MMLGTSPSGKNYPTAGIIVLFAGVLLLLWAWGNWVYRISEPAETAAAAWLDTPLATTPASTPRR